ncbi:MAG: ribosome small subunit-dependent GTPase A [Atopococcus tabaci]|uniref:Small ribosomal subunit biogenesis GTPase RsgA n=1 Tax=Atopococcus tabaci TaxID=269774 RepID=A0AA43UA54_9LACT|nr:ribosome small subunit-dependent GTPase A [Atopococcus tabaci]
MVKRGQIRKALSGFYYVYSDDKTYQTRARGVFRNQDITPLTGDYVEFQAENLEEGYILKIEERKNELIRPPIANIDIGVCVCSAVEPDFSSQLLDRFLVSLEANHMAAIIVLTKVDLVEKDKLLEIQEQLDYYESIGYPYLISSENQPWSEEDQNFFERNIADRTAVFIGQSGAGKSTLLNKLKPDLDLKTAEISLSLGRGKHTTRHVELLPLFNGLIADTPGFSSLDFETIESEELSDYYPDFLEQSKNCKFTGCIHRSEPGCGVKMAVKEGRIPQARYDNYLVILDQIEKRKPKY